MRKWLIDIRKKSGKTQEQIAEMIGVSRPTYTRIENGTRNPSIDIARRISTIFEFEWAKFYED